MPLPKILQLQDLINTLNRDFPSELAEDWDQVGLHFGSSQDKVFKVLVALDIRPAVVEEAISKGVDTVVVHHPPIFFPIQRFNWDIPQIALYRRLIQADIKVFALHTNLDVADKGMNDWLCQFLGLTAIRPLASEGRDNPGLGRIGSLPMPMGRDQVLDHIKKTFGLSHLTIVESHPKSSYQQIAIIGGAGLSAIDRVAAQEPDIFITGDITYHKGQEAEDYAFMTIDAGHYIEAIFIPQMTHYLQRKAQSADWQVEIIASQVVTNPFKTV